MNIYQNIKLLGSEDLEQSNQQVPTWVQIAYRQYRERLLGDGGRHYPCTFGVEGEVKGNNRYYYLKWAKVTEELPCLGEAIRRFLREVKEQTHHRMSLIVFIGPSEEGLSLDEYRDRFWDILRRLHQIDQKPWPEHVPINTEHPKWEFCYHGEPLFVFAGCPAYHARRSRNLGDCMVMILQSKNVFQGIGGDTEVGQSAKTLIRARLKAYDTVGVHESLGLAQQSSIYKWKQYFLPDDQSEVLGSCPFSHQ
ncbi:YqcI/YcgG family protein [Thermoflavimicrobium daqui]|nr:YqcI/YcgG family protein [Thermoflavimicrobium daqui]